MSRSRKHIKCPTMFFAHQYEKSSASASAAPSKVRYKIIKLGDKVAKRIPLTAEEIAAESMVAATTIKPTAKPIPMGAAILDKQITFRSRPGSELVGSSPKGKVRTITRRPRYQAYKFA